MGHCRFSNWVSDETERRLYDVYVARAQIPAAEMRVIAKVGDAGASLASPHVSASRLLAASAASHEFHENCHSVTLYFMKKDFKRCCALSHHNARVNSHQR